MSAPPPFVLPPDGVRAQLGALLAGAGRQRAAAAVLALAAVLGAGAVWTRAAPRLTGPIFGCLEKAAWIVSDPQTRRAARLRGRCGRGPQRRARPGAAGQSLRVDV
jgi:hypothetical protein